MIKNNQGRERVYKIFSVYSEIFWTAQNLPPWDGERRKLIQNAQEWGMELCRKEGGALSPS